MPPQPTVPSRPPLVLLSELFPPAVGGSAVLFHEIYGRIATRLPVHVVTEDRPAGGVDQLQVEIVPHPVGTAHWVLSHPSGARHHWRTRTVLRRVAGSHPAVVHCGRALPEGLGAWLASWQGLRYVCWSHGEDLVTARSSKEYEYLTGRILRGARICVANSVNTANLIASFGVPETRIRVVYPGVDPARFGNDRERPSRRTQLGLGPEHTMLLSVGRLQRRKGHDLAIRAVAALVRDLPNLRYVIVGDGEERSYLTRLVEEHQLSGVVQFVGEVPPDALAGYYSASDVFLLPNRVENGDIEGFGIVFLEAAASGKAVVAGRSGGVPEAVADGETGLLVGGTDPVELASTVRRLIADPPLRTQLGARGRERVASKFTWDRAAQQVEALHYEAAGTATTSPC